MMDARHDSRNDRSPHSRTRASALGLAGFGLVALAATARADNRVAPLPPPVARPVHFAADIQPLLTRHCVRCHGADAQEGELRLDRKAAALAGGQRGPAIVAGRSAESRLVRFVAGVNDEQIVMPPEGERLSAEEIGRLRAWIDQGAAWPEGAPARLKGADHWAFQRPVRPRVPAVKNSRWVRNEIDAFVLARLETQRLEPAPEADRTTLARRVWLDLVGLLPPVDEVARFVADPAPDAYERLVDRLLASPHFGERWGRHWLDLARYADSSGYESDTPRSVWRYRDWIVRAINGDLPFDEFTIEQLAGDLMPQATADQTIASAFHCNAMFDPGVRWEAVLDQVNTTGTVFLGLTVGCAQCHSHKFDPLTQREYFQLYAFFDSASISPFELASAAEKRARDAAQARVDEIKTARDAYETKLQASVDAWIAKLSADERARLPTDVQASLSTGPGGRSPDQVARLTALRAERDPRYQALTREMENREKRVPRLPETLAMRAEPRETRLFVRGNPERPGEVVRAGVPAFLHPLRGPRQPTRLDLAHWLVAADNPLVGRVTVNRIWQQYFGQGIVETANNFGVQTPSPLHRELLDWLAVEFAARSWSVKAVHRLIVCSATYRQSSRARPELETVDPTNRLLAHQRRLRVEAEILRDIALDAGGLLSAKLGGPSVFPPQPPGVLDGRAVPATWTTSPGADGYRRGLYTWVWRLTPYPTLRLFDAPDAATACTRRDRSNTPVQALTLLNDPTFVQCARGLARRVLAGGKSDDERLRCAFQICLGRSPHQPEADLLRGLLAEQSAELTADRQAAGQIAGNDRPAGGDVVRQAAWTVVCRALLSLDEFLTRE
ncbi:MAG TPA: PSD1 and planctomycete cytochrome C domain-containing protein [Planctomycetaceae bacterium]|nr:PSD1 and planctomycete cytochrome C domain-containing protein [Planctomycetaceae bacterium]